MDETHGYEKVGESGTIEKYVKETPDGRKVVYQSGDHCVRVNEAAEQINVVRASPGFFWRDSINTGGLFENERADSPEEAHALAQSWMQS